MVLNGFKFVLEKKIVSILQYLLGYCLQQKINFLKIIFLELRLIEISKLFQKPPI